METGTNPMANHSRAIPAYIHSRRCWAETDKVSPCEAACPLHMDVPNYVMAIAQGDFDKALAIIRQSNPLPSVCGRVCHHPCETDCNRKVVDSPIAIEWLKRFAVDLGKSEKPAPMPRRRERKVAIVGSGPAGLTAAHDLVKKEYAVTVFEASSLPGGVLTSSIPEFVLPLEAVLADIDYIRGLGVRIITNVLVGRDLSPADLRSSGYKAVLIATGLQKSAELKIPGAGLPGILRALPFLQEAKRGLITSLKGKVWVIGGGGVAIDAARTAVRLGAQEVHLACLESRENMPAFAWDIEAAEKEKVRLHPSLSPQEFTSKDGVRVNGIKFGRVKSIYLDGEGRICWNLLEGQGSSYTAVADIVIVAIGQVPGTCSSVDESLVIRKGGVLAADERTCQTNVAGIFAAGDISSTGRTVSDAMAAGRRAAASIDQYLSGKPIVDTAVNLEAISIDAERLPPFVVRKMRWEMPRLLPREAIRTFQEVDLGYKEWQAIEEAKRCLNCRMCANCLVEHDQVCFETARRLL